MFPDYQSNSNLTSLLQAKQELRDNMEMAETEENMGRKRRPTEQDLSGNNQMGHYLMQSGSGGIPSGQGQIPANFFMLTNSNNQVVTGDSPIWTFPSVTNSNLYRGTMSSGLHFMNFPAPVALLPSQQLSSAVGSSSGEGNLGLLAGFNQYRGGVSESQTSGSHSHQDDQRHDTSSHQS